MSDPLEDISSSSRCSRIMQISIDSVSFRNLGSSFKSALNEHATVFACIIQRWNFHLSFVRSGHLPYQFSAWIVWLKWCVIRRDLKWRCFFSGIRCVWLWLRSVWQAKIVWWRTLKPWKRLDPPPPSARTRPELWPRIVWPLLIYGLTIRSSRLTRPKTSPVS